VPRRGGQGDRNMADTTTRIYELQVKLSQESVRSLKALETQVGDVGKSLENLRTAAGGLFEGLLAGASVGAFFSAIQDTISGLDDLADAAERLGQSPASFSEMAYAANLADVEVNDLSTSMKELNKAIFSAGKEGSKENAIFAALGIDPTGKDTTKVMEEIAGAFGKIGEEATKNQLLLELFGKAGSAMRPLMEQGAKGIQAAREEAHTFGLVLTDELAAAIGDYNSNTKKLKGSTEQLLTSIVQGLLPGVTAIQRAFLDAGKSGADFSVIGTAIGEVFKVIAANVFEAYSILTITGKSIGALAAAATALVGGDFEAIPKIFGALKEDITAAGEANRKFMATLNQSTPAVKEQAAAIEADVKMTNNLKNAMHDAGKAHKAVTNAVKESRLERGLVDSLISGTDVQKLADFDEKIANIVITLAAGFDTNGVKLTAQQIAALGEALDKTTEARDKFLTGGKVSIADQVGADVTKFIEAEKAAKAYNDQLVDIIALESDPARVAAANALYDKLNKPPKPPKDDLDATQDLLKQIADQTDSYSQSLSGALVDIATSSKSAKDAFGDFVETTLNGLAQMSIQMLVVKPLFDAMRGALAFTPAAGASAANGAVFDAGHALAFAGGGVVSRPTVFPMASGWGLMGEAGPEAIMPLARTSSGELGVKAQNAGTVVIVENHGASVKTEETQSPNGGNEIRLIVESTIEQGIGKGRFDRVLSTSYGVTRKGR
jgi:hypothetical protein